MRKAWVAVSCLALLAACALPAAPPRPELAPYPDPARWEPAIRDFERQDREHPPVRGAVAFYGSSSIVGWQETLPGDMAPHSVVARGFGGSTLWDALHYLNRVVIPLRPAAIVLYEGDNDIGAHGVPPAIVAELFRDFATAVRRQLPAARVFFLSIKPSPARWQDWPRMRQANELIRAHCARDSLLGFIDVAGPMLDARGLPRPEIFREDSLHLNRRGYELWTTHVRAALWPASGSATLPDPRPDRIIPATAPRGAAAAAPAGVGMFGFLEYTVGPWRLSQLVLAGLLFLGSLATRQAIVFLLGRRLRRMAARTATRADDLAIHAVLGPLGALILAAGAYLAFRVLAGVLPAILDEGLKAFAVIATLIAGWCAFRLIDAGFVLMEESAQQRGLRYDEQLTPLLSKAAKIFVGAMAVLVALQNLGFSVAGLLAGLGIGGLAFGLAAKDTIANLFGSVSILLDRPFRVGDWVTTDSVSGVVEQIGLRSTRIRTFDKSVISIPNQGLANATVENHQLMTRRRVRMTIGLTYDTPRARMREFLTRLRARLQDHAGVDAEGLHVRFTDFGESSLNLLVQYYTFTTDYAEHLAIREELNLAIMEIVEALGLSFAFPTRTLHVQDGLDLAPAPAQDSGPSPRAGQT